MTPVTLELEVKVSVNAPKKFNSWQQKLPLAVKELMSVPVKSYYFPR